MRHSWQKIGVAAFQATFLVVFGALLISNYTLRRELRRLESARVQVRIPFQVGEAFPPFFLRDRNGKRVELTRATAGRATQMVVVDPACGSCEQVLGELRARNVNDAIVISLRPRALSHKIVSLVGDTTPLYFVDRAAPPVLQARIDAVPRIIRIDGQGRIQHVCRRLAECDTETVALR